MTRRLRTLLLSATAVAMLATAATASPPTPSPNAGPMPGMDTANGAAQADAETSRMHRGVGSMTAMHSAMTADSAMYETMLDDPAMHAHLAECGIDPDELDLRHEAGSVDDMHKTLARQDSDIKAMHADCPTRTRDSMATLQRHAGHDTDGHHGPRGGVPR